MAHADPFRELAQHRAAQVLSVSQLTAEIKDLLDTAFGAVWVSGEISNLTRPQSGHCYLTLKDDEAQIRAVIWRTSAKTLRFDLHDGLEVICGGYLDVYGPRGTYQLVIQQILPKGIGPLELALRQLRERLTAEGLFDPARKRPLPRFPARVALVTSPTGAAIRDFLEVLRRRCPALDVMIVPVRVQGEGAGREIAAAIQLVNRLRNPVDVLVVARGGGSLEDLWCFNEEQVVRAIHASRVPVISAVGHEIDVTLSDLVADVRALTPSEAAERIAPARDELLATIDEHHRRLVHALRSQAGSARKRLDQLAGCRVFRRPLERIQMMLRSLDELDARASRSIGHRIARVRSTIEAKAAQLESLSPLTVLARGYSLTRRADDGTLVLDAGELRPGQQLLTRLARGEVSSRVESIELAPDAHGDGRTKGNSR